MCTSTSIKTISNVIKEQNSLTKMDLYVRACTEHKIKTFYHLIIFRNCVFNLYLYYFIILII